MDKQRPSKILGVPTRTQRDRGILTGIQKNQGTIKTKQKAVAVGDRNTHKVLSPERTYLQNVTDSSICERYLEEDESGTPICMTVRAQPWDIRHP
jgi:hypothetical protein